MIRTLFTSTADRTSYLDAAMKASCFYNPKLIVSWPKAVILFLQGFYVSYKSQLASQFFYLYSYLSSFRALALKLYTALVSLIEPYKTDFRTQVSEFPIQYVWERAQQKIFLPSFHMSLMWMIQGPHFGNRCARASRSPVSHPNPSQMRICGIVMLCYVWAMPSKVSSLFHRVSKQFNSRLSSWKSAF